MRPNAACIKAFRLLSDARGLSVPSPARHEFGHVFIFRFSLAFLLLAFAAAFDALMAISFRRSADSFLALATPPRRPISDSTREICF